MYEIRKLRAAILIGPDIIEVDEPDKYGQIRVVEHDVILWKDEYEIVG